MRASLASATSLLAILLMEGQEALATPTVTVAASTLNFGNVLVNAGAVSTATQTELATVTGSGVANTNLVFSAAGSEFGPSSAQSFAVGSPSGNKFSATGSYTFTPSATGAFSSAVTVTDTGTNANTKTVTLTGTGVAPVATGPATSATFGGFVLVNSTQTATVTLNVSNTGNGNLAGSGGAYNLNGSITGGNSVFVGTPSSFSLTDNSGGSLSTSSQSFGFTFKPTVVGTQSTSVVTTFSNGLTTGNVAGSVTTTLTGTAVAPMQSVAASAPVIARVGSSASSTVTISNIGNGNKAGTGPAFNLNVASVTPSLGTGFTSNAGNVSSASLVDGGSTTLGYVYTPLSRGVSATSTVSIGFTNGKSDGTNLSQSVANTLTATGVGPVYASSIQGAAKGNTPTIIGTGGSVAAAGSTISFGTVGFKQAQTIYLSLQNITTDVNGGNANLTNLTIENYTITGANASAFSLSSLGAGAIINEGNSLLIPITVIGTTAIGTLSSSLTVFTDESTALGGAGDTFTYALTAFSVTEPTSLAALGAGLAGLAGIRRRRSTNPCV